MGFLLKSKNNTISSFSLKNKQKLSKLFFKAFPPSSNYFSPSIVSGQTLVSMPNTIKNRKKNFAQIYKYIQPWKKYIKLLFNKNFSYYKQTTQTHFKVLLLK